MVFMNGLKRKWQQDYDLIGSFSDSDDIPDLDAEAEAEAEETQVAPTKANTGRKRIKETKNQARNDVSASQGKVQKRQAQESSPEDEDDDEEVGWADKGENDGSFDPDFMFDDPNTVGEIEEGLGAWYTPWLGKAKKVGVDDIIQRRREKQRQLSRVGINEKQATSSSGKGGESSRDDSDQALDGEEDELLANDSFGMGAEGQESDEYEGIGDSTDNDESLLQRSRSGFHQALGERGSEDEDEESETAAPVPHPDDLAVSDGSDERDSDLEEQAKRDAFFAAPEALTATSSKSTATFQSMQLSRPILRGLTSVGFTSPTPIQSKTVPMALLGKDVVGGAVTGSGKTAAFVLPILERLLYRPKKVPTTRVAVLTPTRELAVQCHAVATKLAQHTDITFALIVGGLSLREQEATLKRRPDVVIATPGRFIDHMRNSASFAVDGIEILVLDEADRMLEDGFADELNELLKTIPRSRQTMLFSATMTSGVDDLIRAGLDKPVRLVVDAQKSTVPKLVQEFVKIKYTTTPKDDQDYMRQAYLLHLCTHVYTSRTIVFIPTKHLAHRVKILFALRNIQAAELHGSMSQEHRLNAVSSFRDGRATHLLATDLASRGLDIPRVETVINYAVPTTSTTYLHRVGRTARAGRGGVSVTVFDGSSSKPKSAMKGAKGKEAPKQAASERALLRPILKIAKSQNAPMRTRALPADSVKSLAVEIEQMKGEMDEIMKEEKEEKLLQQTERDMTKSENLLKHEDEIKGRPRRTWFQSENDKKAAKGKGLDQRLGVIGATQDGRENSLPAGKAKKKLSGKDKKRLDARADRLDGKVGKKKGKEMNGEKKVAKAKKKGKKK
ncbi:MAG: hypothetical protein Q9159_005440 [Coniocarpon cinnabarinum]